MKKNLSIDKSATSSLLGLELYIKNKVILSISHEVQIFEVRYVESVSVNSPQSDGSTLYGLSIPFGSKIGLIIFMMEIDESLLEKCM